MTAICDTTRAEAHRTEAARSDPTPREAATLSLSDRLFLAGIRATRLDGAAARALLKALRLLSLVLAQRLAELRSSGEPLVATHGALEEQHVLVRLLQEVSEVLGARWDKVPDRRRPHYTPEQRFRILRIKLLLALSREETAGLFRVSAETIGNWERDLVAHPDRETIGSTVKPQPPVRRYGDVVHHVVKAMNLFGFGGNRTIAGTLARAGWRIAKDTVGRYKKESLPPSPSREEEPKPHGRAVRPRFTHHVWLFDFTRVARLFGATWFHVATIFDGFSRMPLAVQVFEGEPSSEDAAALLEKAHAVHGKPRHLVSDQGSQFTGEAFRQRLAALRVRQRFGAVGKHGSIALIERFFRSLKDALSLRLRRPLLREDLERRLEYALLHYAVHRPHQGLGGATPFEVYFGLTPAHLSAAQPPRGRIGEPCVGLPFTIESLDPEGRFPILKAA